MKKQITLGIASLALIAAGSVVSTIQSDTKLPPKLLAKADSGAKRYDQPAEALAFYLEERLPPGETSLDYGRYLAAQATMFDMQRYSVADRLALPPLSQSGGRAPDPAGWTELGPGNIGGRTRRLVINPDDPDIMYAGAVAGGIWRTTDAGASWTPLDDLLPNLAVSSLVMDPADTDTLYAGTGEGFFNADSVQGAGIFVTTNGGDSWAQLASTDTADFFFVNDLIVSPNDSDRIYAATRTGIWRSLDAGVSFTQVFSTAIMGGCLDLDIRTDSGPGDVMFATCGTFAQASIMRNTDAGGAGAWTEVFTEAEMGRTSLAISPSDQDTIYALAASIVPGPGGNYNNGLHAVFRSEDGGDTWAARVRNSDATLGNTLLLTNAPFQQCVGGFFNQGWYDNTIAVDPTDSDVVWVGGIDTFRSDNGGQDWGIASLWFTDPATDTEYNHADQHFLIFHPDYDGVTNTSLFSTSDGGVLRTDNPSAALANIVSPDICSGDGNGIGVVWNNLNNGYAVTQFYHGVAYPDGATYFGGTQDNGTLRGTTGGGDVWEEILGGDGGYAAVNPNNTNILFAENTGISIQRSDDGGVTFNAATNGITDTGRFINPFIMDPSDPTRLWTSGSFLWRTGDSGDNWVQASVQLTVAPNQISAIGVAPSDPDTLVAGDEMGTIFRTTQATTADSATAYASTQPRTGIVSSIIFDPNDANIVYATYSTFGGGDHVWRSADAGATWTGIDGVGGGRLPDIPAHSLAVDPFDSNTLYAGTDLGVFATTDGGINWMPVNTGFANTVIETLFVQPAGQGAARMFAFTHGRGAYVINLFENVLAEEFFEDGFEAQAP